MNFVRWIRRMLVVIVTASLLAACHNGKRSTKRETLVLRPAVAGSMSVPVPNGWTSVAATKPGTIQFRPPKGVGEEGAGDGTSGATLDDALKVYVAVARMAHPDLSVLVQRSVRVSGSRDARLLVTRYRLDSIQPSQVVDALDVFAAGDGDRAAHVTLVVAPSEDTKAVRAEVVSQMALRTPAPSTTTTR